MNHLSAKEIILHRIRAAKNTRNAALTPTPDFESSVLKEIQPSPAKCFQKELESVSGKCVLCGSESELIAELKSYLQAQAIDPIFCTDEKIIPLLEKNEIAHTDRSDDFTAMKAAVTDCEFLVARTGSVVVSAAGSAGRQVNIFPPVHIVIASRNQLVETPEDALKAMKTKYNEALPSMISFISGPSRTADIEKTLVLGAHGPKFLFVLIY